MFLIKGLILLFSLVAVVIAKGHTSYRPPNHDNHHEPKTHKDVPLHKLCSWNVIEFDSNNFLDDSWNPSKLDAGRNYIPENNIPTGIRFTNDGRVIVSLARQFTGVFATLAFFLLKDIKDGRCPPLRPFPSEQENALDTDCDSNRRLINVERFNIDRCNRLWAVDRRGLNLNDKNWILGSPRLMIYNLDNDKIIRDVPISSEYYYKYQLGLETVVINSDPKDCGNAYGYIIDTYNGCIIVYSFKQNKFWKVCSPQFYSDAKYSKFTIKTRKHEEVTYFRDSMIFDCAPDYKKNEAICHAVASLTEFSIPFTQLNNEEVARCSPDSLNVTFLGQKSKYAQTGSHALNEHNQVVWGVQELNYGIGCWNRKNKLIPKNVHTVVSNPHKLPYVADLTLTKYDLSHYCKSHNRQGHDETYVAVLSNNLVGIEAHGFDYEEENFGIYIIRESEALRAFPQCLPEDNKQAHTHKHEYQSDTEPSYKQEPSYNFEPSNKLRPSYEPEQAHNPDPYYKSQSYYRPETSYKHELVQNPISKHHEPEPTKPKQHQTYVPIYQHSARPRH